VAGYSGKQAGASQIIPLAAVAVILGAGYFALDMYSGGEKNVMMVESRGMQMISALATYRRDNNGYPDSLDKLVPKYTLAVSRCPNGETMGYVSSGGSYVLSCKSVVFNVKPYSYDSQSRNWSG
jgi:hypothetical protein